MISYYQTSTEDVLDVLRHGLRAGQWEDAQSGHAYPWLAVDTCAQRVMEHPTTGPIKEAASLLLSTQRHPRLRADTSLHVLQLSPDVGGVDPHSVSLGLDLGELTAAHAGTFALQTRRRHAAVTERTLNAVGWSPSAPISVRATKAALVFASHLTSSTISTQVLALRHRIHRLPEVFVDASRGNLRAVLGLNIPASALVEVVLGQALGVSSYRAMCCVLQRYGFRGTVVRLAR